MPLRNKLLYKIRHKKMILQILQIQRNINIPLCEPRLHASFSPDAQVVVTGPIRTDLSRVEFPQLRNSASPKLQQEAKYRDRLMDNHYVSGSNLYYLCKNIEPLAPRHRRTVISALCSLCRISDSPFFHFSAFIHFNSSSC